jgi:hypothetical protein
VIKRVHLTAIIIWLIHSFIEKALLVRMLTLSNTFLAYAIEALHSTLTALFFLYLFSHEDFFKFAKDIEKKQKKNEKKTLKFFKHTGKLIASFLICLFISNVLLALVVRLFYRKKSTRYWVAGIISFITGIIWFAIYKGAIQIIL